MKSVPGGLLLDLDGTLADSIPVMRLVYSRFLDRFGKVGSNEEFALLNGSPLGQVVATLAATHRLPPPVDEMIAAYRDLIEAAYMDVIPNPGVDDLLAMARRIGIRAGVVTSNSTGLTWAWLYRVGLSEMVDAVVGGDETDHGKPNPEPYLLALERMGCEAHESLAVEDSLTGVRAAMAAGLQTFLLSGTQNSPPHGVMSISRLDEVTDFLLRKHYERGTEQ